MSTEPEDRPRDEIGRGGTYKKEGDSSVDVVFSLFTDDTIFLFIGSFIIAESMVVHGLHRRLAYRVLAMRAVGGRRSGSSSPSA